MLSVMCKPFTVSVIMLNVIILNVVMLMLSAMVPETLLHGQV
jgi:hypothetical protein